MKKPRMKPLKIKHFRVAATVSVQCIMTIEADSEEEAEELAQGRSGDEWLDYATGPEDIEIDWSEQIQSV